VPAYLRQQLPLDAGPALDVADKRVKAVFAMAPGIVQASHGRAGLRQLGLPTYITVGAGDTQARPRTTPSSPREYIPHAELDVIPGRVDHDIFVNESMRTQE